MRQTELFTKTRREAPSDEVSKNAQFLIRAGYVHKEMAGVYTFLPLGLSVLNNINNIIREEMNAIGGQEVLLSALQDKVVWEATGRWGSQDVDVWFKTRLHNDAELGLGFTHEEPLTRLMKEQVSSWRDLPRRVYQIQTKFRNEVRAKSGIMRTREFPMKDLYSFDRDEAGLDAFYETCALAYERIFARVGLGSVTYKTFASGGSFSKFSHEFQTLCEAGEDTIFVHEEKKIAVNKEVYNEEVLRELGLPREALSERKAIEVGNIFKLGTRFSEALGLSFKDEAGGVHPVVMGSYGIGPSRLLGTIAEVHADEKGLLWPQSVAPYAVHVLALDMQDAAVREDVEALYHMLAQEQVRVLFDDRDVRAGEKFADSDLIGIPLRIVVSRKTKAEGVYEAVKRASGNTVRLEKEALIAMVRDGRITP